MTLKTYTSSAGGSRFRIAIALSMLVLLGVPHLPSTNAQPTSSPQAQSPQQTQAPTPTLPSILQVGTPLPPGKIVSSNTWNASLATACVPPAFAAEPLSPVSSNATIELTIPNVLFMGSVSGNSLAHTYVFYPNGTVSAKDSSGNSLTMKPITGLPSGTLTTTLSANDTDAFENYLVRATDGAILANVTTAYAIRYQYCQPAGLSIVIRGTADWGATGSGSIALPLGGGLSTANGGDTAASESASGVSMELDWSDSSALDPVFNQLADSVSWTVGDSFVIDPDIVATSSSAGATSDSISLKVCYANSLDWLWYYDGSYVGYRTSSSGSTWSSETTVLSVSSAESVAIACSGTTVYYAIISGTDTVNYRYGTMNSGGTITWAISNGSFTTHHTGGATNDPTTTVDGSGNWWIAVGTSDGSGNRYIEVWKCSLSSCSWSEKDDINPGSTNAGTVGAVLPLTSGVGVVYGVPGSAVAVVTSSNGGSTWSSAVSTSGSCQSLRGAQFVSVGNSVYGACDETSDNDTFLEFTYGGSSWTQTTLSGDNYRETPISTDGQDTLVAFEADQSESTVYYFVSTNLGGTWGPKQTLTSDQANLQPFTATAGPISDSIVSVAWTTGSSSPYDVVFASFPPVVPIAPASPNSWSQAGISPYESYFNQLSEVVSPGNGLLSIEQGTLALTGRGGLNLDIGLVYTQPYGFRSDSPFEYDNFTLADLGNGWALNFPWLGTNYVHLADGGAYPYNWVGDTMTVNNATDFELVQNSGSGTYDLYLPSGMDFHYASDKELLSITDSTGNNTISFEYSSGQISQITDTIGRTVTFSYNGNGQLSSISSGGSTWSFGYVGTNLVSLTDPLSRVTRYEYNDGVNRWLLTGIIYPTLGGDTYSYAGQAVGTEVTFYAVSARNIYSSTALPSLTESLSTSYAITNGLVTWSNSTMSNGTATQGFLDFNFQNSNNLERIYDLNSTNGIVRITENDYNTAGQINETKLLSPTLSLLASSQFSYDNWGNLIYSEDNVGDKTYYSYANTDSQDTFGVSGFSNSFYTPLVVSSNIHDALVGEASFQNANGTVPMETYYKYDAAGDVLQTKQLDGASWLYSNYAYDHYGNQISATDPLGNTTDVDYSATYSYAYPTMTSIDVGGVNTTSSSTYQLSTGDLLSQTDPDGHTTSYTYDALNRVLTITYPTVGASTSVETYAYDNTHNVVKMTDPDGNIVNQTYDGLGRLTSVQTFNGDTLYSTTSYTYNWDNEVAHETTPTGHTTYYTYDQDGRLIKEISPSGTETISYNDVNNIKTVTDPDGRETQDVYNWDGLLTSVREYYKTGAYNTTTYVYNAAGNLVNSTNPDGGVTSYKYDDLNRLIKTTYPDATYETKTYDADSLLQSLTDGNDNTTSYSYNALDRLTKVTYPGSSSISYTYDKAGNIITESNSGSIDNYTYDAMNRLTNETDTIAGAKYQVLYTYDKASNILSIKYPDGTTDAFTYDALNRVTSMNDHAVNFTYTLDDKINTITYQNGAQTTYTYNSTDLPTSIVAMSGITTEMDLAYTYDNVGNVLSINSDSYTYDWLNRLSTATGSWGTIDYNYDAAGNIVSVTQNSVKTTYGYAANNKLTSVGSASLTYDDNGNLLELVNGSTTWHYSYNYDNELTSVSKGGSTVQTNTYDSDGERIKSVQGTQTTVYIYEGNNLIYEKNTGSGAVDKYYYANGMLLEEECECGYSYFYLDDASGSVRQVMEGTSNTLFSTDYKPYGANWQKDGQAYFQFSGKPIDGSTGLYYFGARFYDPSIQRFITQDTFSGVAEDPQSLDRYTYALDNPESNTDPTGSCAVVYDCAATTTTNAIAPAPTSTPAPTTSVVETLPPYDPQPAPAPAPAAAPAPAPSGCFAYTCVASPPPTPPPVVSTPPPPAPPPAPTTDPTPSSTPECSHCVNDAPNGTPGSGVVPNTSTQSSPTAPIIQALEGLAQTAQAAGQTGLEWLSGQSAPVQAIVGVFIIGSGLLIAGAGLGVGVGLFATAPEDPVAEAAEAELSGQTGFWGGAAVTIGATVAFVGTIIVARAVSSMLE